MSSAYNVVTRFIRWIHAPVAPGAYRMPQAQPYNQSIVSVPVWPAGFALSCATSHMVKHFISLQATNSHVFSYLSFRLVFRDNRKRPISMGWTARCGRPPLLLPSCRKLEFRLSALMDSDLAWVNGKSGRQSWCYADTFQRSIIGLSEAIYHFYHFRPIAVTE